MRHSLLPRYVCLKQIIDMTLTFNEGERAVKTMSTLPTLKRKVGYNDTEAGTREERNEKRDKMEIDQVREALED
jgi:predicted DNA-binding WGR domain protein